MQTQRTNVVQWLILIGVCVLILGGIFYVPTLIPEEEELNIPTAQEIADLVVVEVPEPVVNVDNSMNEDIFDGVYRRQISRFRRQSEDACEDEFDWDDVEDLFGKYADCEFVEEFEDDRDFEVIDLGLDDEDDREAVYSGVIKVRCDDDYSEIVYIECLISSKHGDLEAILNYNL